MSMSAHITVHHPGMPRLNVHDYTESDALDEDDVVALTIGTYGDGAEIVTFFSPEFLDEWITELTRAAAVARVEVARMRFRRKAAAHLTDAQITTLQGLCRGYDVEFDPSHYQRQFDLPDSYVGGWVGGPDHRDQTLFVGVDSDGSASS